MEVLTPVQRKATMADEAKPFFIDYVERAARKKLMQRRHSLRCQGKDEFSRLVEARAKEIESKPKSTDPRLDDPVD